MGGGEGEDEADVVTRIDEADCGVHGEAQLALAQLVEAARKADSRSASNVPGSISSVHSRSAAKPWRSRSASSSRASSRGGISDGVPPPT